MTIKPSDQTVEFATGNRRGDSSGKPRYDLMPYEPKRRLAQHYGNGGELYGDRNWELARTPDEVVRFKASAARHFEQWMNGELDEDHASAAIWNMWAADETERRSAIDHV